MIYRILRRPYSVTAIIPALPGAVVQITLPTIQLYKYLYVEDSYFGGCRIIAIMYLSLML